MFNVRHAAASSLAVLALCTAVLPVLAQTTPPSPAPAADTATRPFALSTGTVQAAIGTDLLWRVREPVAERFAAAGRDGDAVTVFAETLGVPWREFAENTEPRADHPWVRMQRELADAARASGKPVSLQLTLARERFAREAVRDGTNIELRDIGGRCFDLNQSTEALYVTAYPRYVTWMMRNYAPRWVNVSAEINGYLAACGDGPAWRALVDLQRASYRAAKAVDANAVVYASFLIDELYGKSLDGFDAAHYAALNNLSRDRFGLAMQIHGARATDPVQLPRDYLSRVRDRNPKEAPLLVADTGWNSRDLALGTPSSCQRAAVPGNDAAAAAYLRWLLAQARALNVDLVTWSSLFDALPADVMTSCYPSASWPFYRACGNDSNCIFMNAQRSAAENAQAGELRFKAEGAMGLRTYEGTPKGALMQVWQEALRQPRR